MVRWNALQQSLKYYEKQLRKIRKLRYTKTKTRLLLRNGAGGPQYYIKEEHERQYHYVRKKELERVKQIQKIYFYEKLEEVLKNNIRLLQTALDGIVETDYDSINGLLPKAYQNAEVNSELPKRRTTRNVIPPSENPYLRENLIHRTSFGLLVRSKSELMIAEILYELGVEFYYEKRLLLQDEDGQPHEVYPDFTIVLNNGRVYHWEHKGMYGDEAYAARDLDKMLLYYRNGIYPPVNLIITMDSPQGGLDASAVRAYAAQIFEFAI